MAERDQTDGSSSVEQARERAANFRELVTGRTAQAGENGLNTHEVRAGARTLLREAKTKPEIAREINSLTDRNVRSALVMAREEDRAQTQPVSSRAAYVAQARRVVADIADPAGRERAGKLLGQMSAQLGVSRATDQSQDRAREREIETSR